MIYRTAPFSMTLNDLYPQFQGGAILWRLISHKRYDIHSFNEIQIHTPYPTVSFRITSSVLEWLSKILNDNWASCTDIVLKLGRAYQWENCLKMTNCACRRCGRSPSPTAWFTQNGWASVVDSTADFLNSAQLSPFVRE